MPRDQVVVRGGESKIETMRKNLIRARERRTARGQPDEPALSGEYRLGRDAREIALDAPAIECYRQMRQTTAGRLNDAGFEVIQDGRPGHAAVKLGGGSTDDVLRTDDALERVRAVFDPPEENPGYNPES